MLYKGLYILDNKVDNIAELVSEYTKNNGYVKCEEVVTRVYHRMRSIP